MDKKDDTLACPLRRVQPVEDEPSTNPFIAFKHFVDDQFAAITRISSFGDLRKKMEAARERQLGCERDAHFRWTGRDVTPDHDEMLVQRMSDTERNAAFDSAMMLLKESAKRNAHVDPAKIRALYEDNEVLAFEHDRFAAPMLSFGGACYYMPETGDNLPSTSNLFGRWPRPSPRFLSIEWFKDSIYSPINLDHDPALACITPICREAFEDLLDATLSKPLRNPSDEYFKTGFRPPYVNKTHRPLDAPGVDWMLSLYCRGILPAHPTLLSSKDASNSFSSLESIRTHWTKLAGSWAPPTAEREFADLVRAVASPPMPDNHNTPDAWHTEVTDWNLVSMVADEESFQKFLHSTRIHGDLFDSPESRSFWRAIYDENADKAAEIIVAWEGKGRDVQLLIDDPQVVIDYLGVDTTPRLWPLCEALEKSHSELLFMQHFERERSGMPDAAYEQELLELDRQVALIRAAEADIHEAQRASGKQGAQQSMQNQDIPKAAEDQQFPETTLAPGVLAALTTTQTTRLPDGSVTTKVVLKKRFADGREETTESVSVERPGQELLDDQAAKKKGWFWS